MSKTDEQFTAPKDVAGWKNAKRHTIVLHSGVSVDIEIPNLAQMIKTGQIPNDLMEAAMGAMQKQRITPELLSEQADFYEKLVVMTVKNPEITEEDVKDLPAEDVEMIVEFATRQRDTDAVYHHMSGLHASRDWRRFRGVDFSDEALEDV